MIRASWLPLLLCALAVPVHAQMAAAPAHASTAAVTLAPVKVTGVQPGPGLWKVSKGGHVLWVLGMLTPLPEHMQWRSAPAERALAQSQELLEVPAATLKLDTSAFGKLLLLPSAYDARMNPDDATLQKTLPPPVFARWQTLQSQYRVHGWGSAHWRPIVAALELYKAALARAGLTNSDEVARAIEKLARRHGVKRTPVEYEVVIAHPHDADETMRETQQQDIDCLQQTMDVAARGTDMLALRANAWSSGDIATLRSTEPEAAHEACVFDAMNADFAWQLGVHDLPARIDNTWLYAAQQAMTRNAVTFALLPMDRLLSPEGPLARLQAEGYVVQAPDEVEP
ncbi:TraB/GumN family protein [Rhodanobacter sp. DHG33]|uniref:TraB/GumN family protein n=1 Tax=Rhodanobacter sp. DHG33 TaxID=2775921 RepID=UPI0017816F52|nr:TraB/GumN family protein [Rhodanobacter sp. DHG33]MBD8897794.1 TraB/GumN family protein [Rhodanobacter sp. DHG33]